VVVALDVPGEPRATTPATVDADYPRWLTAVGREPANGMRMLVSSVAP
jgi:hypothetical protein